ncbi:MAG TPA: NADH-quinone oxidoreductase subunit C [Pyrinomonadaceae bacterium]|nr:NADH-quinone oxidoreductase subunit C [Pyrinomonadaceae bacterium]
MADENRPPDDAPKDTASKEDKTTPEREAALTGKAPSGSSQSGTTVPASSEDPTATEQASPSSEPPGAQPPGGASPAVGDPAKGPSQADAEKAAKIAEARAKAAAAKQAAGAKPSPPQPGAGATPAAGAPKAPVKKKEEGPKPTDASNHPLVKKLRQSLDKAVLEASEFVGQLSVRIERSSILKVCELLRRDADTPFDYLSDLTAVHFPMELDAPFEVVYNLYSIPGNERVRLKVRTTAEDGVETVSTVWPTANWMEREVYDMFGIRFQNHPDPRRLLLPPDWEGHPLRKEYPLEFMENEWTARHLPEFTDVQREQLEQRRNYGLEELSMIEERRAREIFRAGKEILSKDK